MQTSMHKTMAVTMAAVFALTFTLGSIPANADYRDNSGNLPSDNSSTTTILLIGAGVCLATAIVLAVTHHHSKAAANAAKSKAQPRTTDSGAVIDSTQTPVTQPADTATVTPVAPQKDSRLKLYFGLTNDKAAYHGDRLAMDFSDLTLKAGVTIGF
jgi:hypothetical protein